MLVADLENDRIRMLSADLQDVSTLTIDGVDAPSAFELLPDGRVLVGESNCICVLEGLVALMGPKPAAKPLLRCRAATTTAMRRAAPRRLRRRKPSPFSERAL